MVNDISLLRRARINLNNVRQILKQPKRTACICIFTSSICLRFFLIQNPMR